MERTFPGLIHGLSFNPCFRGSRPRTRRLQLPLCHIGSFNPCFRGSRPRTAMAIIGAGSGSLFQSLFSWKSPSDSVWQGLISGGKGFNPCFRGSRPRTWLFQHEILHSDGFQSLFSWKSPSDSGGLYSLNPAGDVSILVFVEVALGPISWHRKKKRPRVSILVFVEVALGLL